LLFDGGAILLEVRQLFVAGRHGCSSDLAWNSQPQKLK
jgi:hypothetical protein